MGRKILSFLMVFILLFSCPATALAAESEAPPEYHCDSEAGHPAHDTLDEPEDGEAEMLYIDNGESVEGETPHTDHGESVEDETPHTDHDENTEPIEAEAGYFLLETICGVSVVVFGTPDELPGQGITPCLVGSRPCVFLNCTNTVTVNSKYDYVCNTHKCAISGCSAPVYQINPNRCQSHSGITSPICQINVDGNLCGKPSVSSSSICCWFHHCPGCLGIGNGNATICYYCQQCWVPGCPNLSTCTNECNTHCPHTCKTHHQNHDLTCHSSPCICYPVNPTINVRAWNSADNSVAVDISSARAIEIELYTSGGVKFATIAGASGTHIFRHNAAQNNGSYYVRVRSAVGYNSGSFPFQVSTLDIAPPIIMSTIVQPANENWTVSKTLTVSATDATNVFFSLRNMDGSPVPNCPDKEGGGGSSNFQTSWEITEQIPGAKTFRIIAADRWGRSKETTVAVSRIDNEKPSKPIVSLAGSDDWHNEDVTVTISGGGAASGIKHYEYRVDGGAWQTGNTVIIAVEDIHVVEAKAVSGSGLESDIVSVTVKIDKTKPAASYTLSPDGWTTEDVIITLFPADQDGSGLASVTLPDGTTVYENFARIQYPAYQNGDYGFTVTDNAGNSTDIVVPVYNIALLDVTVTLNVPFVISPDDDRLYAGGITFQNYSNVPVNLTLQRFTAYGNAPELVGRDDKAWKSLSVSDTKKYISLGLAGNGVDFWLDAQNKNESHLLGTVAKGGAASYSMQGRFGYAWEQAEQFIYGMAVKIAIAA